MYTFFPIITAYPLKEDSLGYEMIGDRYALYTVSFAIE